MDLVPFIATQAALVASWPRSAAEAAMWCGAREFPVPVRTVADWQLDDEVRAHLLITAEGPVGYGELWLDADENEVELARIIIAPTARGKGLGQVLARRLLSEAAKTGYPDVFLRVHPDNETALRCYHRAGFAEVEAELAKEWNAAQPVEYVWMRPDQSSSSSFSQVPGWL